MQKKKEQRDKLKASKGDAAASTPAKSKSKSTGFASHLRSPWALLLVAVAAVPVIGPLVWGPKGPALKVLPIERVPLEAMTVERFLSDFSAQKPVVITGAWAADGWRPEEMANDCPLAKVRTFEHDDSSVEWGKLKQVGVENLQDYVKVHFARNAADRPRPRLYGFEISLKFHCPQKLEGMRIPGFLTEDAFHLATNRTGLGWPSVLVGPEGSETGLHIDTHRLPFWIAVAGDQARALKRFRIFPHDDRGLLKYGRPSAKANYLFDFNPWTPNLKLYPLIADSFAWETEMRSGDLLYIPGGSPHAVQNLADNAGISMNYLDLKTFPDFVKKATPSSPLYHVLKGAGVSMIDELEARRNSGKAMSYFEFAGVRDCQDFCEVHRATMDEGKRPAGLAAYCDVS